MKYLIKILLLLFQVSLVLASDGIVEEKLNKENPGNLKMFKYVPGKLKSSAPMIVLLHGCTQSAKEFSINSGWIEHANKHGIILLMPEQKKENNTFRCFNWFEEEDQKRGKGEAASIAQMIKQMQEDYHVNMNRIYITGFSAGGGMTAVMMATYPELFKAGAISAGVSYGCAKSATAGLMCMYGLSGQTPKHWLEQIKKANPQYTGPYPSVSIWHGSNDGTVKVMNAHELAEQWSMVHGIDPNSGEKEVLNGYDRIVFKKSGKTLVEKVIINSLGHKIAVSPGTGNTKCGKVGTWEEDINLCASYHILNFFGVRDTF